MKRNMVITVIGWIVLVWPAFAQGQAAQPPPKATTGNFGAGFSLTGGNTDTVNFNLAGEVTHDPKRRNVVKFSGLYLRSDAEDRTTADRLMFGFRDEYSLSPKTFLYGAVGYLRDPFKEISYLLNPQGGIGSKLYTDDRFTFALSGGAGAVWEKNSGFDVNASGTLNAGQNFSYKLSDRASLTQVIAALWKTEDFNDALYHFGIALATSITSKAELKVEFLDDYKNVTPNPAIKRNDTAFITSFLYKF